MASTTPSQRTRRRYFLSIGALVLFMLVSFAGRPIIHLLLAAWRDGSTPATASLPVGFIDDASRMSLTAVSRIITIPADRDEAEHQLAEILHWARAEHLPVSIAGARHTMGGHIAAPDGVVINMLAFDEFDLDESDVLHAQGGARWDQIIPFLDRRGRSIEIMQSNNSFTVGGSISVNCHGWQPNRPPIASAVLGLRMMKPDGSIVTCNRNENAELFSLAIGGYGLFGVILDVQLRTVPNERYQMQRFVINSEDYAATFAREVKDNADVGMAYGRLCVSRDQFLKQSVLNVFVRAPCESALIPPLATTTMSGLKRAVFRGSVGSEYGKHLRWDAELALSDRLAQSFVSRNILLNDPVELYQDRSAESTDILHEYFVPPERFNDFIERMQEIIPRHEMDLLNVTVRHVMEDQDSFLRYADREMFALVLLFSQARTLEADARMQSLTQELIDAALECGGRHYLPYRLHASRRQFDRAYPRAPEFFMLKRQYDPDEMFQNQFYLNYGR